MVQNDVLEKSASRDVETFVVWIPMYPGDDRGKALEARNLIVGPRTHHYWDGNRELGKRFRNLLHFPQTVKVAWDVYFLFEKNAEWKDVPPIPAFWQHQLSPLDGAKRLNGQALLKGLHQIAED